jgi:hypothetical protein
MVPNGNLYNNNNMVPNMQPPQVVLPSPHIIATSSQQSPPNVDSLRNDQSPAPVEQIINNKDTTRYKPDNTRPNSLKIEYNNKPDRKSNKNEPNKEKDKPNNTRPDSFEIEYNIKPDGKKSDKNKSNKEKDKPDKK